MKIVLLDDEILALKLLEDTLKEVMPKAEILSFHSVGVFLEALGSLRADIYFLDIHMSGLSGLAIAQKIKDINEQSNLVFVTGYAGYKAEAMDLYASAYLLKPVSPQNVREALQHLRYDIPSLPVPQLYAQTFGMFTLYAGGRAVTFHRRKSKELLAYLIHRRGEIVSRQQLTYILYEDEAHCRSSQKKLHTVFKTLCSDLELAGAAHILQSCPEGLSVAANAISCDLYDFLQGNTALYKGYYMEDYEWGEAFKAELLS